MATRVAEPDFACAAVDGDAETTGTAEPLLEAGGDAVVSTASPVVDTGSGCAASFVASTAAAAGELASLSEVLGVLAASIAARVGVLVVVSTC
ncbi:hypothetical protein [Mycolicibacterium sp. 050158]|uniref:hypothetical protein n=1 Tax=Mycolicibacterium sp. 050158 TaxID=3090602 RepID=UPI00299EF222|nr:hypothetical protein [Mycolicibacterium sp. 050158]MDX1889309.1 hypothetical protein [Mycolicibacterium sp. 050158]